MRGLGPVVGSQTAVMLRRQAKRSEGRGIGPKFVGHDPAWREAVTLEGELAHRPSPRPVAPPRHPSFCDKAAVMLEGELAHRPSLISVALPRQPSLCDKAAPWHESKTIVLNKMNKISQGHEARALSEPVYSVAKFAPK